MLDALEIEKDEELCLKQKHFLVFCESEMNTSNFEQNAINELIAMAKIKTQMKELWQLLKHIEK